MARASLVRARPWADIAVTGNFTLGEDQTTQVNGVATVFTCATAFLTNSLIPYKNGVAMRRGDDYTETSATTYTWAVAPLVGDVVITMYIRT